MEIKKAPSIKLEIGIFRRGDNIHLDLGNEQYVLSLEEMNKLEDLDKRSTITG